MTEESSVSPGPEQASGDRTSPLPTIDSAIYQHTFYGILNHVGEFWTPLAFDSEKAAKDHVADQEMLLAIRLDRHRVVPVRIRLEALPDDGAGHGTASTSDPSPTSGRAPK